MSDLLGLYCLFFFSTVAAYMANKVVYITDLLLSIHQLISARFNYVCVNLLLINMIRSMNLIN